jgi:ABC-type Fe3+/spermidine/putrescine transport system ATPase subunit
VNDARLEIRDLRKTFPGTTALHTLTLDVAAGEFFSLLGPSGCGKTTLLRIIAGLETPDSGAIRLDGADLLAQPAHARPVNTVFQSYALFPHLTARENIAFGLRIKKVAPGEIADRVGRIMQTIAISELAERKPSELSGGQRQRVALARSLINEPRILLLDEPLAAVDQKLRHQLQTELLQLQRRVGLTFICVTHDQQEALSLSDRVAVMSQGRIEQLGAPREIYNRPASRFVAEFLGHYNLIPARVNGAVAETAFGVLTLAEHALSGAATVLIRPEQLELADGGINTFAATLVGHAFCGPTLQLTIRLDAGVELKMELLNTPQQLNVGHSISVRLPPQALRILP